MHYMTAQEVRMTWLNFFKSKGHDIEPGASLLPHHDPTLLWINAGVAALKKYFDGTVVPNNRRITNVQKCIRTNDIEHVGMTSRHHTFFEMMGNFSIGDYFRSEVIPWAFELLTSETYFGIPKEKLYITHHPDDLETRDLWIRCGMAPDHLIPLEDNFWEIGDGPCGPDTEMFFDRGEEYDPEHIGIRLLKEDIENDRYIEIWNIVFSQFNAESGKKRSEYKELPSKNIDTGAGLERFVSIIQGTETNFETDLFLPMIEKVKMLSGVPYEGKHKMAYRVIADHIRSCTFALSDGASFSNEGRGYVLRRILRRAVRYGKKLGIQGSFLYQLVDEVVTTMKDFYPYLEEKKEAVKAQIKREEEKFAATLSLGEAKLEDWLKETKTLTGEEAFKLYDTYGFPFELTLEICAEKGVSVDEKGFQEEMKKQKERARSARGNLQSMNRQSKDLLEFVTPSHFYYDRFEVEGKVLACFIEGELVDSIDAEGDIIVDQTVFYAEMGGQVADTGVVMNGEVIGKVLDVIQAPNGQHLIHVSLENGSLRKGDSIVQKVDEKRRKAIMRNHSCCHLLQAALVKVLGDHIRQEGSFVSDECFRFDFSHFQKMSEQELQEVECLVNGWIADAIEEKTLVLPIEEAKKLGATALFDEKYGKEVRVVTFADVSKEFCGGTHVFNSEDIGCFVIEYEQSIASGIRRIQGRTGLGAYQYYKKQEQVFQEVEDLLHVESLQEVPNKTRSLLQEKETLKTENRALLDHEITLKAKEFANAFTVYDEHHILFQFVPQTGRKSLLSILDTLKTMHENAIIYLVGEEQNNYPIVVYCSKEAVADGLSAGKILKETAPMLQGSGGGKPELASGAGKSLERLKELESSWKTLL